MRYPRNIFVLFILFALLIAPRVMAFGDASWCLTNAPHCVANWRMSMMRTNRSVVSVPDYNGSAYALSNGAASSTWPTMITNSLGTSNVLRFNGTNYLWNASFAVSQPFEAVIIYRYMGGPDNGAHDIIDSSGSGVRYNVALFDRDLWLNCGTLLTDPSGNASSSIWKYDYVVADGTNSSIWINNSLQSSGDAGQNGMSGFYVACWPIGPIPVTKIDVAEIAVYSATNSWATHSNINWYFNTVYGGGVPPVSSNSWYVATNGTASGDGSITNPMDMFTAFRAQAVIGPGDTIYLRGGTYLGGDQANYGGGDLTLMLYGASNAPITIRPYQNERVILSTLPTNTSVEVLVWEGDYTTLRDIEIMNANTNRFSWDTYTTSLTVMGNGLKLINCIIHDTGEGPYSNTGMATNFEMYGCVIYNNGYQNLSITNLNGSRVSNPDGNGVQYDDQENLIITNLDGSPCTVDYKGHGHGFYGRCNSPTTLLAENIVCNGYSTGMDARNTSYDQKLDGFQFIGNAIFANGIWARPFTGTYELMLGGGGVADHAVVCTNYCVGTTEASVATFGSGASPGDNNPGVNGSLLCAGNYFLNSKVDMLCFTNVVFTNNYIGGFANHYVRMTIVFAQPELGSTNHSGTYDWDRNEYHTDWPWPFGFTTNNYACTFEAWTNMSRFDVNSTFSSTLLTNNIEVHVRTNKYDPNRAHVIVINWPTNDNVAADLSALLKTNDTYQMFNAQNPLGSPVLAGRYTGPVSLPITNLSVAIPAGESTSKPPALGPFFNVFILKRITPSLAAPTGRLDAPSGLHVISSS